MAQGPMLREEAHARTCRTSSNTKRAGWVRDAPDGWAGRAGTCSSGARLRVRSFFLLGHIFDPKFGHHTLGRGPRLLLTAQLIARLRVLAIC